MFSFRTAVVATAAALFSTVGADYYVVPSSVAISTRNSWCQSELQQCPYICRDMGSTGASVNTCDAESLTYGCLCNDNTRPNTSEYSLTLPYFICTEWVSQCVAACGGNSDCQGACQQDHPCGATDPKQYNTTTATASSSVPSSTNDGSTVFSGIGGDDDSNSSAAGPRAFELARLYATMATLGLFGMGFMYLL